MIDYILDQPSLVVNDFRNALFSSVQLPKREFRGKLYRAYFIDYNNIKSAMISVQNKKPIFVIKSYLVNAYNTSLFIKPKSILGNINDILPTIFQHYLNNRAHEEINDKTLSSIETEMKELLFDIFGSNPPLKIGIENTKESDKLFRISITPI